MAETIISKDDISIKQAPDYKVTQVFKAPLDQRTDEQRLVDSRERIVIGVEDQRKHETFTPFVSKSVTGDTDLLKNEFAALQRLAPYNIAPRPYGYTSNEDSATLMMEYIDNLQSLKGNEELIRKNLPQIISQIHTIANILNQEDIIHYDMSDNDNLQLQQNEDGVTVKLIDYEYTTSIDRALKDLHEEKPSWMKLNGTHFSLGVEDPMLARKIISDRENIKKKHLTVMQEYILIRTVLDQLAPTILPPDTIDPDLLKRIQERQQIMYLDITHFAAELPLDQASHELIYKNVLMERSVLDIILPHVFPGWEELDTSTQEYLQGIVSPFYADREKASSSFDTSATT